MRRRLAIIPARGGSKRIPRKNIRSFCGKPILAYSIETALNSGLFNEVMVSTDDAEISRVALRYGAKVPFMRSAETSNDLAGLADVVLEVLQTYEGLGMAFDEVCCLLPTAPLLIQSDLAEGLSLLTAGQYETVFPVVQFSYPIQRALSLSGSRASMIWPENYSARSQDLPSTYHDCGQFYWMRTPAIRQEKKLFTKNSGALVLPETRVQDIDSEEDWKLCELKYSMLEPASDDLRETSGSGCL